MIRPLCMEANAATFRGQHIVPSCCINMYLYFWNFNCVKDNVCLPIKNSQVFLSNGTNFTSIHFWLLWWLTPNMWRCRVPSQYKFTAYPDMGVSIIKIKRSPDRLIYRGLNEIKVDVIPSVYLYQPGISTVCPSSMNTVCTVLCLVNKWPNLAIYFRVASLPLS